MDSPQARSIKSRTPPPAATLPAKRMKIIHINNQLQLGGAETVMRQLARGIPGSRIAVADGRSFPRGVQLLYPRWLAWLYHTRLHPIVERLAPRARCTDAAFRRLAHSDADLLHLHNFHGRYASIESLAYVARRKPLVWTFHALWGVTGGCDHPRDCPRYRESCGACPQLGRWPLGPLDDTAAQLAAKLAQLGALPLHIVAPSRWLAEIVRESRVGKSWQVHHLPNAVSEDFRRALPTRSPRENAHVILVVNRNFRDEQKGFAIIKAALAECASDFPRATQPPARGTVLLAGENSDWAANELPDWDCEPLGYLADPAALAAAQARADIFLFASPAENFPCVVLEAMAAANCIVATPSGGVGEQIEDGKTGLLSTAITAPALAIALRRALESPTLRHQLGEAARARAASEYSEQTFLARHRALYESVLQNWHPPA